MKTAVSLPDDLFEDADDLAHRTGRSRSELYALAIREYIERHDEDRITAALDAVYAGETATGDPFVTLAAELILTREPW